MKKDIKASIALAADCVTNAKPFTSSNNGLAADAAAVKAAFLDFTTKSGEPLTFDEATKVVDFTHAFIAGAATAAGDWHAKDVFPNLADGTLQDMTITAPGNMGVAMQFQRNIETRKPGSNTGEMVKISKATVAIETPIPAMVRPGLKTYRDAVSQ